mgnify:CR=1 FL=1
MMKDHNQNFFLNIENAYKSLNLSQLNKFAKIILRTRKMKGALYIIGVGGSAGNSSHAVNDFRKICGINAFSPTDNISEITARTNDDGWEHIFSEWLKISKISSKDCILIFSVGGGNLKKNVSINIINAIKYAKKNKVNVLSILGRNDGYAAKNSTESIIINTLDKKLTTPVSESFQSVIWHCLVSNPILQINKTKW